MRRTEKGSCAAAAWINEPYVYDTTARR